MPNFWRRSVIIAAAYGQLGEHEEAAKALRDLLAMKPNYAEFGPRFFGRWMLPEMQQHIADGLRKAGLGPSRKQNAAASQDRDSI